MKKNLLIGILVICCVFIYFRKKDENRYDLINAVSGATPLAIAHEVPEGMSLAVDGMVRQAYRFSASALNGFAATRIRTREVTPEGAFRGAYIHVGIPVFNILEGVAPQKPEDAAVNQPLDILVKFTAENGSSASFSFNEIIMADDSLPVTLAFYRAPVEPTNEKVKETYDKNILTGNLGGLRLIVPGDPDTARYLDNVTRITYTVLPAPDALLPERTKGKKCASVSIQCIDTAGRQTEAVFRDVARLHKDRWIMIGHGHGYDETISVSGYDLRSFLKTNFPAATASDFFLFVACDGYRCLFSGREIFATQAGSAMMIADTMDGKSPEEGFRLAPTADYFNDRSMWGLAWVVRISGR